MSAADRRGRRRKTRGWELVIRGAPVGVLGARGALGDGGRRPGGDQRHGSYTEGVTRRLSAAAFARTDWLAVLGTVLTQLRKDLKAAVRKRLRWLFPAKEADKATGSSEPKPPEVVLGEDYALWVRRRIKKSARPVPVYGFHQEPVVHACDRAIQHMRRRRAAVVAVVAVVVWQAIAGALTADWAVLVLLAGLWGIYLAERYLAQQRLNALLAGELHAPSTAVQAHALPYFYERRRNGDFQFLGIHQRPPGAVFRRAGVALTAVTRASRRQSVRSMTYRSSKRSGIPSASSGSAERSSTPSESRSARPTLINASLRTHWRRKA